MQAVQEKGGMDALDEGIKEWNDKNVELITNLYLGNVAQALMEANPQQLRVKVSLNIQYNNNNIKLRLSS